MDKIIHIESGADIQELFGLHDRNIKNIEKEFKVKITLRAEHLKISGTAAAVNKAFSLIEYLLGAIRLNQSGVAGIDLLCLIKNFKKEKQPQAIEVPPGLDSSLIIHKTKTISKKFWRKNFHKLNILIVEEISVLVRVIKKGLPPHQLVIILPSIAIL